MLNTCLNIHTKATYILVRIMATLDNAILHFYSLIEQETSPNEQKQVTAWNLPPDYVNR